MTQEVIPLGARVLVRIPDAESVTPSGLVLPDTAKEKPQRGEVVAIGDDTESIPVQVGDTVLFAKYSGSEIEVEGTEHLILDSTDLLAVLRDGAAGKAAAAA